MFQPRLILVSLLIFLTTACNFGPLFSSLSLSDDAPAADSAETAAQPAENENELKDTQVGLQTPPTLAPEPTPLPPEAIAEADAEELLLINLYERVNPSVVNIVVTVEEQGSVLGPQEEIFPTQGQGSGFIYDTEGHIITNNHVIAEATKVEVTFYDGSSAEAKVIGTDPDSDLAVVKVDLPPEVLRPVAWGDSDQLHVGQRAVAIGNPFGLSGTLTSGIISALKRSLPTESGSFRIPEIVQTDAAINPGNSGGPLLNSQGEVIGVNTAIVPRRTALGERSFLGVGFAIPSNLVVRVVPSLIKGGQYQHPWIGFSGSTVTPEIAKEMKLPKASGALVAEVISGSPADKAGLRSGTRDFELSNGFVTQIGGDVIIAIEDEAIETFDDLISFLARRGTVGEAVTLTIIRNGKEQKVELTLEARPEAEEIN
ncbi:MAG: trypsin-like peptidase domain-containing protein [Anaerolineales bacterium]|nr:trypsin-like peptidase domain-containing protein [Anaerolineales bacterium]